MANAKPQITDSLDTEIPEDGVCPACDHLVRGHTEVERVLRLRGIRRGVQYCRCPKSSDEPTAAAAQAQPDQLRLGVGLDGG